MKKFLLPALFMCLYAGASAAETPKKSTDANLFGHVVDRETHEHLPYATVAVTGTAFGATTDASGHYFLKNLPEGELTLEVRALGYAVLAKKVTLERGQTLELNFEVVQSGISMDEVVVSASRSATLRREAPALVSVLDAALFEKTDASCLAQGLSFQPGVRVEDDCQNCGFAQVRINGLDGHYSQILVDSHPVFSALTGVYGLEQIPANMIERVEVLRGGGSALYGSSAIGGTINVITKEPSRNSAQLAHTLTSLGGSSSYDNNTMLNASLVTESGRAGLCVFAQNRHRSGYDHDGDGFTELPLINRAPIRASRRSTTTSTNTAAAATCWTCLPTRRWWPSRPTTRSTAEAFRSTSRRPTAATVSMPMRRSRIRPARATTVASRTPTHTVRRTTLRSRRACSTSMRSGNCFSCPPNSRSAANTATTT